MRTSSASIAAIVAAVSFLPAATANASGTLTLTGGHFEWTGTTGNDTLTVSGSAEPRTAPQLPDKSITFRSPTTITVGASADPACDPSATIVRCDPDGIAGADDVVVANGGDGNDSLAYDDGSGAVSFAMSVPSDFDGGTGGDTLNGSKLTDIDLRGGTGVDTINGEQGDDRINGDDTSGTTTDGADLITGGTGNDIIDGQGGVDTIDAQSGNDSIDGGDGNDTITAGPENDTTVDGGPGAADVIRYDEPTRGGSVVVDLSTTTGEDGGPGETTEDARNFERVIGTAEGDLIAGDDQANVLEGAGGGDVLRGAGATDVLRGGDGFDTVSYAERGAGEPVTVVLDGLANDGAPGENDDVGADIENAAGGAGGDDLTGNDGPNALEGGAGADTLTGLGDVDVLLAGPDDDVVKALDGNGETVDCGDGGQDRVDADGTDQLTGCEIATVTAPPPDAQVAAVVPPVIPPAGAPIIRPIGATIARSFRTRGDRTRITRLTVKHIPAGATVLLTCKPPKGRRHRKACPFARFTRAFPGEKGAFKLVGNFDRRKLRAGTVVEVRVSAPLTIGRVLRLKMRSGKLPRETSRCLQPGLTRPARCA